MTEDELDAMLITARRQARELIGTQMEESAEAAVAGLLVDLGILQDRLHQARSTCWLCGGEGRVGGLVVCDDMPAGDERCAQCHGTGRAA